MDLMPKIEEMIERWIMAMIDQNAVVLGLLIFGLLVVAIGCITHVSSIIDHHVRIIYLAIKRWLK